MLKLKSYSDSQHGWIAVKRTLLVQLGIADQISVYSYQSKTGSTVYVEEDGDANTLMAAINSRGLSYVFEHKSCNGSSRIRNLPRYSVSK